jgi:hypothetical protein
MIKPPRGDVQIPEQGRDLRPRFSLRSLLGLAMLVAVIGYWRDLPRQNAKRFAALINAGEYSKAEEMFGDRVGISNPPTFFYKFKVELLGQSPSDWLRGQYPMNVTADLPGGDVYALAADATATGASRAARWNLTLKTSAEP